MSLEKGTIQETVSGGRSDSHQGGAALVLLALLLLPLICLHSGLLPLICLHSVLWPVLCSEPQRRPPGFVEAA